MPPLLLRNWKCSRRHAEEPAGSLEKLMVTASELREGVALRLGQEVYRVLEVETKAGAAKMGGTVRARLSNVRTGRLWDQHFRPLERLEDVDLEKRKLGRLCT
jgi:translation elongation factor P/translation initiation factor 5A